MMMRPFCSRSRQFVKSAQIYFNSAAELDGHIHGRYNHWATGIMCAENCAKNRLEIGKAGRAQTPTQARLKLSLS